ncbi:MAG: leucyl/phenylalanyl-tRNA--protein transferase [Polyangiaceae bacterium]
MTIYRLSKEIVFPPASHAEPSGLLAVGGDLRPERLLLGYASGIFPWYSEGRPILWHSPDPRYVLEASALHVPRSLEKQIRRGRYEVRLDQRFRDVIVRCGKAERPFQKGTWITRDMIEAYVRLFELGFAHSAEAYLDGELVGGLYGVSLGSVYFGESMFADAPDASKVAFVTLVRQLLAWGIDLVDCQVHTEHLERFGAVHWPRDRYVEEVAERTAAPTRRGRWVLDETGDDVEKA